jgi:hypothetical protein
MRKKKNKNKNKQYIPKRTKTLSNKKKYICKHNLRCESSEFIETMNTIPGGKTSIIDFSLELWRHKSLIEKLLEKLSEKHGINEINKYVSQYKWFEKKKEDFIKSFNLEFIEYQNGHPFDIGMTVQPINIGDFDENDVLLIEKTVQPTITYNGKLIKNGSVMLKKENK